MSALSTLRFHDHTPLSPVAPLRGAAAPPSRFALLSTSLLRPCLFTPAYPWLIALATLDLFLTATILNLGGREANALARAVIEALGPVGMVPLKFGALLLILLICEYVGRRRESLGRRIALFAIAANTAAVTVGLLYLALYASAVYT